MSTKSLILDVVYRRNDLGELTSNVPHVRVWHSPDGFEVGYSGSGPAEFALNILLAFGLTDDDAAAQHQAYKSQFIATAPKKEGTVTGTETLAWLTAQGIAVNLSAVKLTDHQIASGLSKPKPLPSAESPKWVTSRVEVISWLPYSARDFESWLAEPMREKSVDYDYGCHWRHEDEIGRSIFSGWRISWIQDTGELYALCQRDGRGIVFERLFNNECRIEHFLRDWADAPLQIGCMLNTEAVELRQSALDD